jgi:hypothetical protein
MLKVKKNNYQLNLFCVILIIPLLLLSSTTVYCAVKYYYYLQIGSFQRVQDAVHLANKLRTFNESTIITGEKVSDLENRYPVYLGPFSSWQELNFKLLELTSKGLSFERTLVHKKTSLIQSNLKEKPEITEKKAKPTQRKVIDKVSPPAAETVSVAKKLQKGHGRNIRRSNLALGINHTTLEVQTEVTKRKLITFNGTTTATQDVSIESINKNKFSTSMHIDTIRTRFGLTDYLEIFADIGLAFDELSDLEFVYGGGTRLNLFKATSQSFGEFYLAFQGEYLGGALSTEYKSSDSSMWEKETDWQELTGRMELGVVRSWFTAFAGGVYFLYREDTERSKLENLPSPYTSYVYQDELEEENNYGVYGGIGFRFSPSILLNIEGQIVNQKSVCVALEYHF